MRTTRFVGAPAALIGALLLCTAPTAFAYETWTNNGDTSTYCASCHGDYRADPYRSKVDGQWWPADLHDIHRDNMLSRDCNTCHTSPSRVPTFLGSSNGGNGLGAYSCMGCHGRAQDGTGTGTNGWGAGLRQKHFRAGETICLACHSDSDPANKTVVGENVLPDYYANPGSGHPNMPTDPCNPPPDYNEDFAGTTLGIDNDGDGTFDDADPDCGAAATPGETSGNALAPLLATSVDTVSGIVSLSYGAACSASDNRIVYGPLADVAIYGYSGQECAIGNTGAYDWSYPSGSIFFLVVADDGANEGSYGPDSAGSERPPYGTAVTCPLPQDLSTRCD